jgi:5-formyltetrahydrofolate cyclo-ligase
VFDRQKNRLGYGKGCYDKFFAGPASGAFKLALAYDFQIVPSVPVEPTDVKMDKILCISV